MAMEDAGGTGDLALMINTEMIILKGAVKASTYAGKTIGKGMIAPLRLIQYIMKLRKEQRISESDFKDFTQFMKDCEGDYIIANLPTRDPERLDELMDSMTEVGITYCMLPDLDIQNSCCQIAIRGKDVAKWQSLYESYVTSELDLGGPLDFEELKALTSGNYKIKNLALGDSSEDNEQLQKFLDMLDERKVNYAVLPDLKYGDNHIQLAVANQSLPQFSSAIEAYLQEFPSAVEHLEEDLTDRQYYDSGRMSENDYFNTATEDLKETMHPEKWKAGKDRSSDSFEEALVGKELSRYETLKARPGLTERYVPAEKIVAKQGDEIALQVGNNEYVRIQEALSIDNGRGCIIFLDPEKDYASYHPDENNTIRTPTGNISGKQLSRYTEKAGRDIVQRLDYIPYDEPNAAPVSFTSEDSKRLVRDIDSPTVETPQLESPSQELPVDVLASETPVTFPAQFLYSNQLDTQVIARIPGTQKYVQLDFVSTLHEGKTILAAIDPQKEYTILKTEKLQQLIHGGITIDPQKEYTVLTDTENGLKATEKVTGDELLTYYAKVRPDAQKQFDRIVNHSGPQESSKKRKKPPLPRKDKTMKL